MNTSLALTHNNSFQIFHKYPRICQTYKRKTKPQALIVKKNKNQEGISSGKILIHSGKIIKQERKSFRKDPICDREIIFSSL